MTPREQKVYDEIKRFQDNGFYVSIFWITATQRRAETVTQLEKKGIIRRKTRSKYDRYPICVFDLNYQEKVGKR